MIYHRPPPPPPKRRKCDMAVRVKKHSLLHPSTVSILIQGWKVKTDSHSYPLPWTSDVITPSHVTNKFDILGEKLDKAFGDHNGDVTIATRGDLITSKDPLSDLLLANDSWSIAPYKPPALPVLIALLSEDDMDLALSPPPPPPPPPPPKVENIAEPDLDKSQYSPSRSPPEDDSDQYMSADEDFPPPAPSPPSFPSSPEGPKDPRLSFGTIEPETEIQETEDNTTLTERQCEVDKVSEDEMECDDVTGSAGDVLEAPTVSSGSYVTDDVTIATRGDDVTSEEMVHLLAVGEGPKSEEIDSPEEIEELDEVEGAGDDEEADLNTSQISTFSEVVNSAGQIERVLYFRKSKFRPHGTSQFQLDKMRLKMDYKDACKRSGIPHILNKEGAGDYKKLCDRVEPPKKKRPIVGSLPQGARRGGDSSKPPRKFGVPLSALSRPFRAPTSGPGIKVSIKNIQSRTRLQDPLHALSRPEKLLTSFCSCWANRPFHDGHCAQSHDNFVQIIMNRQGVDYGTIKLTVKDYYGGNSEELRKDPVKNYVIFKTMLAKNGGPTFRS